HRRWVQWVGAQILPLRMDLLGKLRGLHVAAVPLGLAQRLFVQVNQQHVFHSSTSISSPTLGRARTIYTGGCSLNATSSSAARRLDLFREVCQDASYTKFSPARVA